MADGAAGAARAAIDIRAVADAAGVAVSTASNALNDRGRMTEATRERVRAAAERLGYVPNRTAQLMRAGRTGLLGIRERLPASSGWQWDELEFIVRLIRSCCSAAWDRGLYPVLLPSADTGVAEHPRLDAVIVIDPLRDDPYLAALDAAGLPYVCMGRDVARARDTGWWADNDKAEQAEAVLERFAAAGRRRPLMLTAATGQSYMSDNALAFRAWCERRGVAHEVLEIDPGTSRDECAALVRRACARFAPDGIYVVVEALVSAVIEAVQDSGLAIPGDVELVTSSLGAAVRNARVPITSWDLDPEALGSTLVDLVAARLAGDDADPRRTVPMRLVEHRPSDAQLLPG